MKKKSRMERIQEDLFITDELENETETKTNTWSWKKNQAVSGTY